LLSDECERIGEISLHIIDSMLAITPAMLVFTLSSDRVKDSINDFLRDRILADQVCSR
jgi:hypothetical protein